MCLTDAVTVLERFAQLDRIEAAIYKLLEQGKQIMNAQERAESAIAKIDVATTAIAAKLTTEQATIADLRAELVRQGVSEASLTALDGVSGRLEALAAVVAPIASSIDNPVPIAV